MVNGLLRKIALRVVYPNKYSSERFIKYLKKIGVNVGVHTYFFDPKNTKIDLGRANYLSIGSYCKITTGCQFLCHDYSWSVLRRKYHEILPDSGRKIEIGDNVFIGWNVLVIGPVKIGDNCIIGANSVVTHDIPDNSVYAGNPAKMICTLEEYREKKEKNRINDALIRAKHIYDTTGRLPTKEEMAWFGFLYLERTIENEMFLRNFSFKGDDIEEVIEDFYNSKPCFKNYDEFTKYFKKNQRGDLK